MTTPGQGEARVQAERGNVLVIATVVVAVFIATTASVLAFTFARKDATNERARNEAGSRAVDAAVGVKIAKLMRFDDKCLFGTLPDGTKYAVVARVHPQGDLFKLTAAALPPGATSPQWTEVVVERLIAAARSGFRGAMMAKQSIEVSGSARINGNNHRIDGTPVALGFGDTSQHDQVAIISKQSVVISGGAKIAGCGDTTFRNVIRPGDDGNVAVLDANQNAYPSAPWGATADDHFPTTPDQVLSSPDGTAKRRAQQLGTLFTSAAQWEAWKAALPGGIMPPNQLIYLDFQALAPGVDLDTGISDWGDTYHTVIQHWPLTKTVNRPKGGVAGATVTAYVDSDDNGEPDPLGGLLPSATGTPVWDGFGYVKTEPDGGSMVKVPHVQYNGVLILDDCSNMNSGARIFGGVCYLAADTGSTKNVANGGAEVTYSAASIDRAIAVNLFSGTSSKMRSYRERTATYDAQLACEKIGVAITVAATPEDELDADAAHLLTEDGWRNDWGQDPRNGRRSDPAKVAWVAARDTP